MVSCRGLGSRLRDLESGGNETEITIPFEVSDWKSRTLTIIRSGIPEDGEVGAHLLPVGSYSVNLYKFINDGWARDISAEVAINHLTGNIRIQIGAGMPFNGKAVINYARNLTI